MRDLSMPAPAKPKKTKRNQPVIFQEAFAPAMPLPTAPALPAAQRAHLRYTLIAIWALATLLGGIGVGRLLLARTASEPRVAGVPVATAVIRPAAVTSTTIARPTPQAPQPSLIVAPAAGVQQAQAGSPFETSALAIFHPAERSDALQPGFAHLGHIQGNIGTSPIR